MSGASAASIWAGCWCLRVLHVCFRLRSYLHVNVLLLTRHSPWLSHPSCLHKTCLFKGRLCILCFWWLPRMRWHAVCACHGIDWARARRARLSCCKSSADIQAHGDLQFSDLWSMCVALQCLGQNPDSGSANHVLYVSVSVRLHDRRSDSSGLICAQGVKCSFLFGAVCFTKCCVWAPWQTHGPGIYCRHSPSPLKPSSSFESFSLLLTHTHK